VERKERRRQPDIIVVLTTQWRAQATGYAGDPNAQTPVLDKLASRSLDLFQAVTPHPFGVFARAAFLTGLPCPENGVVDYFDPLPQDARTIAHRFSEIGYKTAFFGKWQLFERNPAEPVVGEAHSRIRVPESRRGGFDYWEGFESGFLLNDPLLHGAELAEPTRFEGYQSDVLVERCCRWLERRDSEVPALVVLSLDAPHPPYGAPANNVSPVSPDSLILDDSVSEDEALLEIVRQELSGYYAHIQATDAALGRLVRFLEFRNEWDDTIFAFSSAHGDMHGASGKLRKGWPYEESIRVPMLLSWPFVFDKPRRDPALFSLIDLGPTLMGLIGKEWKEIDHVEGQGKDLSGVLVMKGEGPNEQSISMPSVPPFDKQCPYTWSGRRTTTETKVSPCSKPDYVLSRLRQKT